MEGCKGICGSTVSEETNVLENEAEDICLSKSGDTNKKDLLKGAWKRRARGKGKGLSIPKA